MSELTIQVVDAETSEPIAGARVGVFLYRFEGERPGAKLIHGVANSEGVFPAKIMFRHSKEAFLAVVAAARAHYQRIVGMPPARDSSEPITLQAEESKAVKVSLPPGRTIEGQVTDEEGKPIEGARVFLFVEYEGRLATIASVSFGLSAGVDSPFWPPGCHSDEDGRFEWTYVSEDVDRPGKECWALQIQHEAYVDQVVRAPARGRGDGERIVPLQVVLRKGHSVQGQVISAAGEPVPRARVRLLPQPHEVKGQGPKFLETNEGGIFLAQGLTSSKYRVDVWGESHKHATTEVDLAAEKHVETTIEVPPGCSVEGQLLGPGGQGVEGRVVMAFTGKKPHDPGNPFCWSDESGKFRLLGLPPTGEVTVYVQHRKPEHPVTRKIELPSAPLRFWIPGLELKVGIVSEDGVPVEPPGRVRIHGEGREDAHNIAEGGSLGPVYLQPGQYRLVVEIPGRPEVTETLNIPEEGLKSSVEIRVPPAVEES